MNTNDTLKKIDNALTILDNVKIRQQEINKHRLDKARENTDKTLLEQFKVIEDTSGK
uniref:Uncharacterized protein n=1 Tax=Megaviridae environmental sample TaxID=1737588 RepID=A0A5J6VK50_9VIRU|nr:MAG: hypothetical protein [Megaviridae environmental sample]